MPARTSPVPAVASAGAETTLTAHRTVRLRDDRVVALEDDDTAPERRGLARAVEPVLTDLIRVFFEEPPELACVRCDHGRLGPRGEAVEPTRVGVQAIGVEDERQRRLRRDRRGRPRVPRPSGRIPGPGRAPPPFRMRRGSRPPRRWRRRLRQTRSPGSSPRSASPRRSVRAPREPRRSRSPLPRGSPRSPTGRPSRSARASRRRPRPARR